MFSCFREQTTTALDVGQQTGWAYQLGSEISHISSDFPGFEGPAIYDP